MQSDSVPVSTEEVLAIVRRILNEGDIVANDVAVEQIERAHPLVSRYLDGKSLREARSGFANDRGEYPPLFLRADDRTGFTVAMDVIGLPAILTFSSDEDEGLMWCDVDFVVGDRWGTDAIFSQLRRSFFEIYRHKFTSEAEGEFFACQTWKLGEGYITLQREWTADPDVAKTVTVHRFYSGIPTKT